MVAGLRVAAHGDEQGAFELNERLIGAEAGMRLTEPGREGLARRAVESLDFLHGRGQVAFIQRSLGSCQRSARTLASRGLIDAFDRHQRLRARHQRVDNRAGRGRRGRDQRALLGEAKERASSGTVGMPFSA